jgi:hypothetical protein
MTDLIEKEMLLEKSGYRYHFSRMIYFNRGVRRAFSREFVDDNTRQEIQRLISEPPSTSPGWTFYFNKAPSDRVSRELAEELGG